MGKLFGTDGVRGVANSELTPELAFALGRASADVLGKSDADRRPVALIGKDTRISGDLLEAAIIAGFLSAGGDVVQLGVVPTPAVAYLTRERGADCGIVVSASHNSFEYNGIKYFGADGYKLSDATELEIEESVMGAVDISERPSGAAVGRLHDESADALAKYTESLLSSTDISLDGFKVVVDAANGAAYKVAADLFTSLGASVKFIGNVPDGININDGFGSTQPKAMQAAVIAYGADLGLGLDGDADRLIACDETGQLLDGDKIIYICACDLKSKDSLTNDLVTVSVMSNIGLKVALTEQGIKIAVSDVGDRYVLEEMQRNGSILGGEQSGHIIFGDRNTTGDGLYAALRLIESIFAAGITASEFAARIKTYPQILVNAKVANDKKMLWKDDPEIAIAAEKIEKALDGRGRVLLRASGTEPLVRVMIEGEDQESIETSAHELALLIEKKLA
jgi:phosphoglucosamine mutase